MQVLHLLFFFSVFILLIWFDNGRNCPSNRHSHDSSALENLYLRNVVCVAPAFPEVDQFITATAFNLPATIKNVKEKAWNQIDKRLMSGNPPIQIPFNALELFIAVSVAIEFYDTVGYRIIVENM